MFSKPPSKRSAHKCAPVELSIGCPVMRTLCFLLCARCPQARTAPRAPGRSALAEGNFKGRAPTAQRKSKEVIKLSNGMKASDIAHQLAISRVSVFFASLSEPPKRPPENGTRYIGMHLRAPDGEALGRKQRFRHLPSYHVLMAQEIMDHSRSGRKPAVDECRVLLELSALPSSKKGIARCISIGTK